MPRIVPSDVVRAIDRMFPQIVGNPAIRPGFDVEVVPRLRAIVSLVEAVPTELVTLDPAEYADLVLCVAALRGGVEMFTATNRIVLDLPGIDQHPIAVIHERMKLCPDEAPAPSTAGLPFIADNELRESIRLDISAGYSNLSQGEWKGATVLGGSAIEALLLWALQQHEGGNPGSVRAGVVRLTGARTLGRDPGPHLEGPAWHLHEYLEVGAELGLIRPETATLVRLARDFRNLIHPGRAARLAQKCDRATALTTLAAVEAVSRDVEPRPATP